MSASELRERPACANCYGGSAGALAKAEVGNRQGVRGGEALRIEG
jgi:hypothetical protein